MVTEWSEVKYRLEARFERLNISTVRFTPSDSTKGKASIHRESVDFSGDK